MSLMDTLLLINLLLPLMTVLTVLLIKDGKVESAISAKVISLLSTLINLLFSVYIYFSILPSGYHFVISYPILKEICLNFSLGIDGVSLLFLLVSNFLFLVVFIFIDIKKFSKSAFVLLLLLEFAVIGTFVSFNLWFFYIFFELSVFITFFLMKNVDKLTYVQYKFLIFNVLGSLIMFVCLVYLIYITKQSSFLTLFSISLTHKEQSVLWWGFFLAFAIKSSLFPFHLWVKDIYSNSDNIVNIILSGILIKFGVYGFLRIVIPAFPLANLMFENIAVILALVTTFYTMFLAFITNNVKSFLAYFSLSHVGVIILGIFSLNAAGVSGAIFQSISHSVLMIGLILTFIVLEKRVSICDFSNISGLVKKMPFLALFFMIMCLSGMSLPGTNAFIGEYLILQGLFSRSVNYAIIATLVVVFSAVVMLTVYKKLIYGTESSNIAFVKDFNITEKLAFSVITVIIIALGLYPQLMLNLLSPYVNQVIGFIKSQEVIHGFL